MMDGEIIVSSRARRQWTREKKLGIVEESFRPDLSVLEVARRHDLDAAQIYQWRKAFGSQERFPTSVTVPEPGDFVAVSVLPDVSQPAVAEPVAPDTAPPERIEIELVGGRRMSVPMSMDAERLGSLVQALEPI
jgi:transposase